MKYGDYLSYEKADNNYDGKYDCVKILDCDESATSVTIPNEIDGLPVTSIGLNAFSGCTSLASIDIPNSVTYIGDWSFIHCESLESVTIPDSVTDMGNGVFYNCKNLKNIKLSNNVTKLDGYERYGDHHEYYGLFEGCTSLESIEIPDSVTSIGIRAFNGTPLLENQTGIKYVDKWVIGCDKDVKTAKIKDGIQFIEDSSFKDCTNLESIEISDSVTSIRNSAFDGCTNLKNVKIGNGVTYIGRSAFYGCESIESIEIPDSVTSIDFFAFRNCVGLTKETIKNPNCIIKDQHGLTISNEEKDNKGYFNGTIYGYENSSVQKYAEYFKYNFESIGESPIAVTNNEFHPSAMATSAPKTSGGGSKTYYKPKSITEISQIPQTSTLKGDSNGDGKVNVRDCAFIASKIAQGKAKELPLSADYNGDGVVNVRDAAAIARDLSKGILK